MSDSHTFSFSDEHQDDDDFAFDGQIPDDFYQSFAEYAEYDDEEVPLDTPPLYLGPKEYTELTNHIWEERRKPIQQANIHWITPGGDEAPQWNHILSNGHRIPNLRAEGIKITNWEAEDAFFNGAVLTRTQINQANWRHVQAEYLLANESSWRQSILSAANTYSSSFRGASFSECKMLGWHSAQSVLTETKLSECNMTNVHLPGSNLEQTHMEYVIATSASLRFTKWQGAHLHHIDFSYADLTGAHFIPEEISDVNLCWSTLTGISFGKQAEQILRQENLRQIRFHFYRLFSQRREALAHFTKWLKRKEPLKRSLTALLLLPTNNTSALAVERFSSALTPLEDQEYSPADTPVRAILLSWCQQLSD